MMYVSYIVGDPQEKIIDICKRELSSNRKAQEGLK
jgi:hypothetical protein